MPLYGAVTKLTGLSFDADGCTLRVLAVATADVAPTASIYGGGIDYYGRWEGRKESQKKHRVEGGWCDLRRLCRYRQYRFRWKRLGAQVRLEDAGQTVYEGGRGP